MEEAGLGPGLNGEVHVHRWEGQFGSGTPIIRNAGRHRESPHVLVGKGMARPVCRKGWPGPALGGP